jgi:hypothetical protein
MNTALAIGLRLIVLQTLMVSAAAQQPLVLYVRGNYARVAACAHSRIQPLTPNVEIGVTDLKGVDQVILAARPAHSTTMFSQVGSAIFEKENRLGDPNQKTKTTFRFLEHDPSNASYSEIFVSSVEACSDQVKRRPLKLTP